MTAERFILDDDGIVTDMVDLSMYMDNEDCCEKLNELHEENNEFKINEKFKNKAYSDLLDNFTQLKKKYQKSKKENKELQERNDRQAKQLDNIYQLIEQRDWRALSDIMDDFQKAEEQLQKEWSTYGDV